METETITNTIKDLLKIGTYDITFTGGEPTLRKDFSELISSVEKDKACSLMFTSGYFADKTSLKDLKESGLDGVFVSLDSPLAKKHNSFRGVKVFERAKEMIKISKSLDLLVGISTYATHTNIRNREILKMLKLGEHLGVNEIVVFDCVPTGKLIKKDDVMLTAAEHEYLVNLQKKVNRDKNSPRLTTMSFINFNNAGCFGGMSQIHITASGDVAPCDFTPLSFGNIQRQSIKEIWNKMRKHPEYRNWRNRCRMQSPDFRKKYINKIPDNANLPYPIDKLDS
jgi:MoaA/NifB/PqqE/SkfB family radical SAM enzyme